VRCFCDFVPDIIYLVFMFSKTQDRLSSSRLKFLIASNSWERGSGDVGPLLRPPLDFTGFRVGSICVGGGGGGEGVAAGWDVGFSLTCRLTGLGSGSWSFSSTLVDFKTTFTFFAGGSGFLSGRDVRVAAPAAVAAGDEVFPNPFTDTLILKACSCSCCSLANIRSLNPVRRRVF